MRCLVIGTQPFVEGYPMVTAGYLKTGGEQFPQVMSAMIVIIEKT